MTAAAAAVKIVDGVDGGGRGFQYYGGMNLSGSIGRIKTVHGRDKEEEEE